MRFCAILYIKPNICIIARKFDVMPNIASFMSMKFCGLLKFFANILDENLRVAWNSQHILSIIKRIHRTQKERRKIRYSGHSQALILYSVLENDHYRRKDICAKTEGQTASFENERVLLINCAKLSREWQMNCASKAAVYFEFFVVT